VKSQKHNRDTVGTLVEKISSQAPDTHDIRDQGAEMMKPYLTELFTAVERGKKQFYGPFFIVVLQQRFRGLNNVLRNYFIPRSTCPTPDYDQTVYAYYPGKEQEIEYVWTIPDRQSCHDLIENALTIEDEYRELLKFVMDFKDGTLFKLAQTLNNEYGLKTGVLLKVLDDKQASNAEESCGRTY
jgi:hypothetical protein